jgi:hypothetical protein
MVTEKVYKCNPYYLACGSRGKELTDEEHYTNGRRVYHYFECKSKGVNPISGELCRHCLWSNGNQNHWLVPRHRSSKQGKVKVIK